MGLRVLVHLIVFGVCLFFGFQRLKAENVIPNGSFENGLTEWDFTGLAQILGPPETSINIGSDGVRCVELGAFNVPNSSLFLTQPLAVTPQSDYRLTFDMLASALGEPGRTATLEARIWNDDFGGFYHARQFSALSPNTNFNGATGFSEMEMIFSVPAGVTEANLAFKDVSPNGGAAVDPVIDNVRLSSVSASRSVVAPFGFDAIEDDGYGGVLSEPVRQQTLYQSGRFPEGKWLITEMRFRRDASSPSFFDESIELRISLSTTPNAADELSMSFQDNIGADELVVSEKTFTLSSAAPNKELTPNPFEIAIPFTQPFPFDPKKGNLLVDIINRSGSNIPWVDGSNETNDGASRIFSLNPESELADFNDTGADVIQFTVIPDRTEGLEILPMGGEFNDVIFVEIKSSVASASIYYTLDGSRPDDSSTAYAGPISLKETTVVSAILFINGYPASEVLAAEFNKTPPPPDILFSPADPVFFEKIDIVLSNNLELGDLRHTLDGAAPNAASPRYETPISIDSRTLVSAAVFFNGFQVSDIYSKEYLRQYVDDGTLMDAEWLEKYFGANYRFNPDASPHFDPDQDGYTNMEEFERDTDPIDPESHPELLVGVGVIPLVSWNAIPGRTYVIWRRSVVNGQDEVEIASLKAENEREQFIDMNATRNAYYRVELLPASPLTD